MSPLREARRRSLLLRWGLPRDPAAGSHVAGFLVSTVAAVLLTRAFLAAAGYPQIGGDGLHVAHVLWGGLLMAVAFVLLLTFSGPVVRPAGAVVGGVGFGLFVDEIGKFVTSDNDYFYEPTAALVYVTVVALVLLAEWLQRRVPHHPVEHLAAAADHAVAGLVGGFTPRARAEARAAVQRAEDGAAERVDGVLPGAPEVRALLEVIDEDPDELPNLVDRVGRAVVRVTHGLVSARWVPRVTVGVLLLSLVGAVARGLAAWATGADVPWWIVVGLLVSAVVATVIAVSGLVVVGRDRALAYARFRRAVLLSLLVTQVFVFRLTEWAGTVGLLVDLLVLGVVVAELNQIEKSEPA